eukprot:1572959-Amphidinium_carterae.2
MMKHKLTYSSRPANSYGSLWSLFMWRSGPYEPTALCTRIGCGCLRTSVPSCTFCPLPNIATRRDAEKKTEQDGLGFMLRSYLSTVCPSCVTIQKKPTQKCDIFCPEPGDDLPGHPFSMLTYFIWSGPPFSNFVSHIAAMSILLAVNTEEERTRAFTLNTQKRRAAGLHPQPEAQAPTT